MQMCISVYSCINAEPSGDAMPFFIHLNLFGYEKKELFNFIVYFCFLASRLILSCGTLSLLFQLDSGGTGRVCMKPSWIQEKHTFNS